MQVSIACTEHNLKSRNGEDRLLSKQSSTAPNVVNAARAKFRTVAIIARSLGTFTPQHHISLKESTAKQTGMKYRQRDTPLANKYLLSTYPVPVTIVDLVDNAQKPDEAWGLLSRP
ncbi:Voltage-gated potassium channel subunit beta-1 [Fukomys damarensis]|uniref:Voltage-gated potassium channel subunit beta-1 n=1 Tax=Fukomys damarensis TaxID=885580 RepID=A0A091D720_FUKDA|nr:Voltage-gated potassium channel subunit beta-1 [Fukomys damarensis]